MASITPDRLTASWYQGIGEFVLNRKKTTGGFGATPRLPATIQDTYHGLRILTLLARHGVVERSALGGGPLLDYLTRGAGRSAPHNAKVTFQRLASLQLAGGEVHAGEVFDFVHRRLRETASLEECYYCGRLVREIAQDNGAAFNFLTGWPEPWSFRAASELWMLLSLAGGRPDHQGTLTTWLQDCQTYDGGFGFLPGTTSFIENCYDCLRALRLLGSHPRDAAGCRDFVLACRTASHGFARRNGATAFLSSTWQAVAVLELLAARFGR